jgi:hypothetical protein
MGRPAATLCRFPLRLLGDARTAPDRAVVVSKWPFVALLRGRGPVARCPFSPTEECLSPFLGLQGTCDLHALFKSHALKSRTAAGLTLIFPFAYCAFIFAFAYCACISHCYSFLRTSSSPSPCPACVHCIFRLVGRSWPGFYKTRAEDRSLSAPGPEGSAAGVLPLRPRRT